MALFEKLKNIFGGAIADDLKDDCLVSMIKNNAVLKLGKNLTVAPNTVAVLVGKGKVADLFVEGNYRLEVANMPILSRILKLSKPNRKGVLPNKFKADIYLVNLREFNKQQFFSTEYVVAREKEYKDVKVRLGGDFAYQIISPVDFIEALLTQYGIITDDIAKRELSNWVANLCVKKVQKNKPSIQLLHDRASECFIGVADHVNKELADCGVKILNIEVTETDFPKKIFKQAKLQFNEVHEEQSQQDASIIEQKNNQSENNANEYVLDDKNSKQVLNYQEDILVSDNINIIKNQKQIESDEFSDGLKTESQIGNINFEQEILNKTSVEYKRCHRCGAFNPSDNKFCFSCKKEF